MTKNLRSYNVTCQFCGKEFVAGGSNATACSKECRLLRKRLWREQQEPKPSKPIKADPGAKAFKEPYVYRNTKHLEPINLDALTRVPIENYENVFVSESGEVFELKKLHQSDDICGYQRVYVHRRAIHVHTLMAVAFLGERPPKQVVRHLNDIKTDNRKDNLAYGTYKENCADAKRNGRLVRLPGKGSQIAAKFTDDQVREIRLMREQKSMTLKQLQEFILNHYGIQISQNGVSSVVNRKNYKHVT